MDGLYLFDLRLNPAGYHCLANDRVNLIFTPDCEFTNVLVKTRTDFWNEFELD